MPPVIEKKKKKGVFAAIYGINVLHALQTENKRTSVSS